MTPSHQPLISVVLATYNGSRFLREQLDSLFSQTYLNVEVLVVDDHSTDDTVTILKEYQHRYPSMRLFVNESNLGYVRNFEKGLSLATGEWIATSDQDDIWHHEKLTRLAEEKGACPAIYCNSELIDSHGKSLGIKMSDIRRLATFDSPLNFALGSSASGHAMLVEKKVVMEAMPFPSHFTQDYWIGYVASLFGPVKYLDEILVQYRQHSTNVIGVVKAEERNAAPSTPVARPDPDEQARMRMRLVWEKCPDNRKEKIILYALMKSYERFSLMNNFKRMILFFRFNRELMAFKNRSLIRRWFFCFKMFIKII